MKSKSKADAFGRHLACDAQAESAPCFQHEKKICAILSETAKASFKQKN